MLGCATDRIVNIWLFEGKLAGATAAVIGSGWLIFRQDRGWMPRDPTGSKTILKTRCCERRWICGSNQASAAAAAIPTGLLTTSKSCSLKNSRMELNDASVRQPGRGRAIPTPFACSWSATAVGLFRLAFRMTGIEQDAEDVVQESFLRAYKQLAKFDERASFGTWLYRIAANCSLDLVRAPEAALGARWRRPGSDGGRRSRGRRCPRPIPTRSALALSGEVRERVAEAMDELSATERTAFVLRHFEGMRIEEVSRVLECQPGAAKHSVFRAVQKLRRALEPIVSAAR